MFGQMLRVQWMGSRALVALAAILAFAIPLGSVYYGGDLLTTGPYVVSSWLSASRTVGQAIPILALALGALLGMSSWAADHQGRHPHIAGTADDAGEAVHQPQQNVAGEDHV